MTQTQQQLFAVLRTALWLDDSESMEPATIDWPAVIALATDQAVQCLVYDVVRCLPAHKKPPVEVTVTGMAHMLRTEQRNRHQCRVIAALFTELEQSQGLHPMLMKGQALGSLYPEPTLRQTGDIDVYLPTEDECGRAVAWAAQYDDDIERKWREQHHMHDYGCTIMDETVELHLRLETFTNPTLARRFTDIIDRELHNDEGPRTVTLGGRTIATLPPTLGVVHQLIHITRHLLEAGVGLRQLCDLAVFVCRRRDDINREQLQHYIDELDLTVVAAAIGHILHHNFGVPASMVPFATDDRYADFILNEIFSGGNFGVRLIEGRDNMPTLVRKLWSAVYFLKRCLRYRQILRKEARSYYISKISHNFARLLRK